jgi:hypothetical protein
MKKIFLVVLAIFLCVPLSTNADDNINKVFKIEAYEFGELTNSYHLKQYWSAVYIENGIVYTNAHVILDEDNEPIWNYRVCKTTDFKNKPECFTVWKLLYYDTKNDLAAIKISKPWVNTVQKSKKSLKIWDVVKVYGYPSNGWETITYTEWKISWYENRLYKIDANIDAWNSGWWVFDWDWNLIWVAVSVKVWYTTIWYIIPLSEIQDFKNKINVNSIKNYDKRVNSKFFKYHLLLKTVIWSNRFSNTEIDVNGFTIYGFKIDDYHIDNDKKFYAIWLSDKKDETYIEVNNINYSWKNDIDFDDLYGVLKNEWKKIKEEWDLALYKVRKLQLKDKNTILRFAQTKEWEVALSLLIEISKNNYQFIIIVSDNIKNKSFLNWLKIVLKNIKLKTINYWNNWKDSNSMKLDNLETWKQDWFYIEKNYRWDNLKYPWWDIEVAISYTSKDKIKDYKDYTLSSYIKQLYNVYKDDLYFNYYWIKQTNSWEYYVYNFARNDVNKSWEIIKNAKKYALIINFFDKKDDKEFYTNTLTFKFDKVISKKIIDDFINNIKTSTWELPFALGDLKAWKNLIQKAEFNFK